MNSSSMKRFFGEFKHPLLQTLGLSILCHLAVFSFFVFTFSLKPESFKPEFVFWGAILKQQDVRGTWTDQTPTVDAHRRAASAGASLPDFFYEFPRRTAGPWEGWDVEKPRSSGGSSEGKAVLKPAAGEPPAGAEPSAAQTPAQEMGIDYDITPYKPLRGHPR